LLKGRDFIYLSWLDWAHIPLLPHQTATRLSKNNRVVFVEPPYAVATFAFQPGLRRELASSLKNWRSGLKKISDNLYLYTFPPLLFNFGFAGILDRINQNYLKLSLKKLTSHLEIQNPIIWSNHPYILGKNINLNQRYIIFDCNDKFVTFARFQGKSKRLLSLEDEFTGRADIVFTTSSLLFEERKKINPNTHYFPSGVDVDIFLKSTEENTPIPEDIKNLRHPLIGYFGAMDIRMDWELVSQLTATFPQCSLVFIGPVKHEPPASVRQNPKIFFTGRRDMKELPAYLKGFDLCILPFLESEFTKYSFPTKVYEFFASGKPVISMEIPAFRALEPLVKVARTSEEFLTFTKAAIEQLHANDPLREERILAAKNNTWDSRMHETGRLILKGLQTKSETICPNN
jgi:glycosyltransferase involved in cell wall biosynthesis